MKQQMQSKLLKSWKNKNEKSEPSGSDFFEEKHKNL